MGVTAHPNAQWIAQQLTETYGWKQAPQYLIRNRDSAYGGVFVRRLGALGIHDRPISPGDTMAEGICGALIGRIRRDWLDQVAIFGEQYLFYLLRSYQGCYNEFAHTCP